MYFFFGVTKRTPLFIIQQIKRDVGRHVYKAETTTPVAAVAKVIIIKIRKKYFKKFSRNKCIVLKISIELI